jgi:signal transduction histidine kinase
MEENVVVDSGTKERILVIDDDETLRETMLLLFKKYGYQVQVAENGKEGLKRIQEQFYDLIILDIRMPDMDGVQVLKNIRAIQAEHDNSYVIITTGYASENVPIDALKLGAADYIMKPFELADFMHSVEQNLKIIRAQKEKKAYVDELARTNAKLRTAMEELKATEEKLLAAERLSSVGKVAASVGHEMRNPLASIKNISFFLNKKIEINDPQVKNFLKMLSESVEAANRIVTDLIDYSYDEMKVHRNPASLDTIVNEALASVPANDAVKVIRDIAPEAATISVDADRFRQVLFNLFSNAFLAMPTGGELRIAASKPAVDTVRITVSDTGFGMSDSIKEHIFEPLFTTRIKGIGLGLPIVKNIVEKHGGRIEVGSIEGKGTIFTIYLPQ